jgi:hypothetical protein
MRSTGRTVHSPRSMALGDGGPPSDPLEIWSRWRGIAARPPGSVTARPRSPAGVVAALAAVVERCPLLATPVHLAVERVPVQRHRPGRPEAPTCDRPPRRSWPAPSPPPGTGGHSRAASAARRWSAPVRCAARAIAEAGVSAVRPRPCRSASFRPAVGRRRYRAAGGWRRPAGSARRPARPARPPRWHGLRPQPGRAAAAAPRSSAVGG